MSWSYPDDIIRDFWNAKGTRYTRARWGVARDKGNVWFILAKKDENWWAGFRDMNLGVEIKFNIIPDPGTGPMNALRAYRAAMDTYAAFVLGNEDARKCFESIEVVHSETRH